MIPPREYLGGEIRNNTYTLTAEDRHRSHLFPGFTLPSYILHNLGNEGVENIVFIDPNRGRYTSTLEDWIDSGVEDPAKMWTHLNQSRMTRG